MVIIEPCAVCGEHTWWVVGVGYGNPDHTTFFCPTHIPEEFKIVVRELPMDTPGHLRWSFNKLRDPKCPYTEEQKDRAERRMHAKAKEFGFRLPRE